MQRIIWSLITFIATLAACVDEPYDVESGPQARIVTTWDPLACGDPHRVVVELEDYLGLRASRSVPCELGGVSIDVIRWGIYRGRIYAWRLEAGGKPEIRSEISVRLEVDQPVVSWHVETPK